MTNSTGWISEIFDIVSALETAEGKGTNFCSLHSLARRSIPRSAPGTDSTDLTPIRLFPERHQSRNGEGDLKVVQEAFARAPVSSTVLLALANFSRSARETDTVHGGVESSPDKNPNDKKIADRFARLGTIAGILRDAEKRAR